MLADRSKRRMVVRPVQASRDVFLIGTPGDTLPIMDPAPPVPVNWAPVLTPVGDGRGRAFELSVRNFAHARPRRMQRQRQNQGTTPGDHGRGTGGSREASSSRWIEAQCPDDPAAGTRGGGIGGGYRTAKLASAFRRSAATSNCSAIHSSSSLMSVARTVATNARYSCALARSRSTVRFDGGLYRSSMLIPIAGSHPLQSVRPERVRQGR